MVEKTLIEKFRESHNKKAARHCFIGNITYFLIGRKKAFENISTLIQIYIYFFFGGGESSLADGSMYV